MQIAETAVLDNRERPGDGSFMTRQNAAKRKNSPRRRPSAAADDVDVLTVDVLIVGGGMVGLSLAVALSGAGLAVTVIDREDPATHLEAAFDGRSSAIAQGSQQALAAIGLWPGLAAHAQPILDIRVSDGRVGRGASSLFLHYDHRDLDHGPLGHIVENRAIRALLYAYTLDRPGLTMLAPAGLAELERGPANVTARPTSRPGWTTAGRSPPSSP